MDVFIPWHLLALGQELNKSVASNTFLSSRRRAPHTLPSANIARHAECVITTITGALMQTAVARRGRHDVTSLVY